MSVEAQTTSAVSGVKDVLPKIVPWIGLAGGFFAGQPVFEYLYPILADSPLRSILVSAGTFGPGVIWLIMAGITAGVGAVIIKMGHGSWIIKTVGFVFVGMALKALITGIMQGRGPAFTA